MPTREMSRQRAKSERLQAHKKADNLYVVYNPTSQSAYSVHRSVAGTWSCTCPFATKGSRVAAGDCKHLIRVLDKEDGCTGCGVKDETLRERKCTQCRFYDKMGT